MMDIALICCKVSLTAIILSLPVAIVIIASENNYQRRRMAGGLFCVLWIVASVAMGLAAVIATWSL